MRNVLYNFIYYWTVDTVNHKIKQCKVFIFYFFHAIPSYLWSSCFTTLLTRWLTQDNGSVIVWLCLNLTFWMILISNRISHRDVVYGARWFRFDLCKRTDRLINIFLKVSYQFYTVVRSSNVVFLIKNLLFVINWNRTKCD